MLKMGRYRQPCRPPEQGQESAQGPDNTGFGERIHTTAYGRREMERQ